MSKMRESYIYAYRQSSSSKRRLEINSCVLLCSLIFVGLVSCATTPKQSGQDILALRTAREEASKHYFRKTNLAEVEQAVIDVFELLDKGDVEFDARENKLLVSRRWTYYAIFIVGFGKDYWEIAFAPDGAGVRVSSAFTSESNQGMFAGPVATPFKGNIGIGGNIHDGASVADYHLLYSRIEYLLGQRDKWMTCEDAERMRGNSGEGIVLCEAIGLEDASPDDNK